MELKEIKQVVELMNKNELSYFHLEKEDFRLEMKKGPDLEALQELAGKLTLVAPQSAPMAQPMPAAMPQAVTVDAAATTAAAPAPAAPAAEPVMEGDPFESPMVGTFYRQASPESEPFVKVGQEIDEDTTICIIEAMKVFNEIKAERRGTIVKILVDNATPVQYGEPLFIIK